jgi:hypothetical protein
MKNVAMSMDGDTLVIRVNMKETHGRSGSGKTTIIASTEGNITPPGAPPEVKLGLNIYTK